MQSVASGSTSALNFLELLGVDAAIKVLDMSYVTSPCLMRLAECGAIRHVRSRDVGDYETSAAWLAATSSAGLVLTDSFGTGATGGDADVVFDASYDPGFLNRGEWIKFVALFFNAEAAANAYFDSAVASVAAAQAAALAAAAANAALNGGPRPVVAFAAYDQWSGEWQLSNASYKMQYVAAANGVLAPMPAAGVNGVTYKDWTDPPTTAAFSDAASARAALAGVSVLIDETPVWPGSPETYTLRTFLSNWGFSAADVASSTYPFLKSGRIFREDKTINDGGWGSFGTDWFANSVSQPQVALADFLSVLYPGTAAAGAAGGTVWLRNLAANEPFVVRESSQCVGSAATAVTAICGGPSTTLTLRNLRPAAFTPAALEAAIMAALPSGTTASVTVTDFTIAAMLRLSGPSSLLDAAGGTSGFLGALGGVLRYPVASPAASPPGRRLLASSLSLPVQIDSFGMDGGAACAAMLATLANSTALLAAAQAAGAVSATSASAADAAVSATVSVTVRGGDTTAAMATLSAAASNGQLNAALAVAGMADPVASAAVSAGRASFLAALLVALAVLLA